MYATNQMAIKLIQNTNGNMTGKSIKNQLNALQLSIGCAPFWKALIAIKAIDKITPDHDMHPIVNFVDFLTSSAM